MSTAQPEQPTNLVVFGATGDLSIKKLFPSLLQLFLENALPENFRLFAVSRRSTDTVEGFIEKIKPHCDLPSDHAERFDTFTQHISMAYADIADVNSFAGLQNLMADNARVIYYFSVSPTLYPELTTGLKQFNLINEQTRVVVEKPLGHNLATAQAIDGQLRRCFKEEQLFRIDHYLGKETVQNLMALRFGNAILEPLWGSDRIQHIQITVAENIGVANRGPFYESTGALRDMVQNHLLQLLCVITMEPPSKLNADCVRAEKLKVLNSLKPIQPRDVLDKTVRGQYTRSGKRLKAKDYTAEAGVDPNSTTETFTALKVEIENMRWAGVPIYLRTGKNLTEKNAEIVIQFKPVPHDLFSQAHAHFNANRLVISLQPEESIKLFMNVKAAGKGMHLQPISLDLDLTSSSHGRRWKAYERLLLDVIEGDLTLFMREEDVMAAWRWIDPIIEGWETHIPQPDPYEAGTWGPASSDQLLARDGNTWHNE